MLQTLNEAKSHHQAIALLDEMKEITRRENFLLPVTALEGFYIDDATTWTKHNVFTVFHFLHHETVASFYYRIYGKVLAALRRDEADPIDHVTSEPLLTMSPCHRESIDIASKLQEVRVDRFHSAARVSQMLENLQSRGLLRYTPSYV
jgi:hypothetical protein